MRLVQRREHHREAAAHAVREAGGDPVGDVAELEPLEEVAGSRLPAVEPTQPRGQLEVLPRRRARDQPADVGAVADDALDVEGVAADVVPRHPGLTLGGRHHAREDPHRGGLAGAVAAEQRGGLAGEALEVDTGDGLHLAEAHMEAGHVDDRVAVGATVRGGHPRILPESATPVAGLGKDRR